MKPADSGARAILLPAAADIERIAAQEGEPAIRNGAVELARKIEQNRFHLVVVGQFKRGKTTFLNALLGESILPVAILPLTSIVTLLRYGEAPKAVVRFLSREPLEIRIDQLADFVTEAGNPRNAKGVSYVEVFHPSEYLHGGVALIDTPGIASVYVHNTQVTYDFLPRIDAAIFITSPEPPLTSAESQFLSDLAREAGKTFVVMNKADLMESKQLAEVVQFARSALPAGLRSADTPLLTISARQALEAKIAGDRELLESSGFPTLEAELNRFLRDGKGRVFLASASRNLLRLIADLRMYLALRVQTTKMPIAELRGKIAAFNEQLKWARQQQEDNDLLLKGNLARLSASFEAEARGFAESQAGSLSAAVRDRLEHSRSLPRKRLAKTIDRFIAEQIQQGFDGWRTEYEASAAASFRQISERFQNRVNELIRNVRETAGTLFGVDIGHLEAIEELVSLDTAGYHVEPSLGWGLGNAPLLLPGSQFRRYLLRHLVKKAPEELERNATRVAYDFKRRLNKSGSLFQQAMNGKLSETIGGIQRGIQAALDLHESGSAAAEQSVRRLSTAIRELDQLGDRIQRASFERNEVEA